MQTILTSQQMAAADAYTIQSLGVAGIDLMERAALACCEAIVEMVPQGKPIGVIVGSGNNGGDGLAIARLLLNRGYQVTTLLALPDSSFTGDAAINFERLKAINAPIHAITDHDLQVGQYALLVDALFGTGLNRPIRGPIRDLIDRMNALPVDIFSVDLPSGLSGSTGKLQGEAIRAVRTVTFQHLKLAHVVTPSCTYCGKVTVADIGIHCAPGERHLYHHIDASHFKRAPRDQATHKGSFGSLAIIGGFSGMEGAANLAAVASLRFGVGKVRVYTNNRNRFHHDSVMVDNVAHYQPQYNALLIGPGLSRTEEAYAHIRRLSLEKERIIWDADALYFLKKYPPSSMGSEWVMTPHPGEAAMLLECLAREIQQDRLGSLEQLGEKYPGGWIVLKGYRSLIRSPSGDVTVCASGNPALAVAGSGDVLSGMLAAMMAQGYPIKEAVLMSCLRHGMAGDHWSSQHPDYAMLAEDIIADLIR